MGYETQRFLVVDTETTGLSLDRVRLLEIAAIPVVDGVICDKEIFHEIVNPGVVVPRSVSVLHGIRGETLVGKPRPRTILKSFLNFSRDSILVMQNGWFDIRVINKELWLAKLPPMRNSLHRHRDHSEKDIRWKEKLQFAGDLEETRYVSQLEETQSLGRCLGDGGSLHKDDGNTRWSECHRKIHKIPEEKSWK